MKCWLSAGKQRREARLSFEQQGYLGRTNFCRLDSCSESSDDSVLLVLEIEEAQQSVRENLLHLPACAAVELPRPSSSRGRTLRAHSARPPMVSGSCQGAAASAISASASASSASTPPEAIDSVMKLQRATGGVALEDVKLLPSIWTARQPGDIAAALDGFHQFSALKSWRKPSSSCGRRHGGSACAPSNNDLPPKPVDHTPWAEASHRSAAAPTRRYDMYAK